MAKLYGEIAASALLTLDKSFARALGQPLDSTEVYYSKAAAETYAATPNAYVGQKIVVVENGVVTHYSIENEAGALKELGSKPVGDEKSITVAEDGTVSLKGVGTLVFERDILGEDGEPTGEKEAIQYQPLMTAAGLVWVEPSKTTVEGLATLIDALTVRVGKLESAVGNAAEGENAATGLFKAIADEEARATAAEEALGERIDGIVIPVTGIAADDKILALTDTLISATVSLGYDEDNKAIKLYGKDSVELGSVDATPFIKDGMLNDVEYDAASNTLTFIWNTDSGDKSDTVVLSDIIEPYTAGAGLVLSGNEFAIQLAEGSESFLTVTADGLKLAGVQAAIDAAKAAAIADAEGKIAEVAADVEEIGERVTALEGIDHDAYATKEELKTTDDKAVSNASAITNLTSRLDGIVAQGGEPNVINNIKVNGVTQTIAEDKSVDITVPTKFSDLTDDSGFDARITAAQIQADKGVNDAAAAQTAANAAQADVDAVEVTVGEHSTKISGLETTVGGHITKIAALENADIAHKAEYDALNEIVSGHTADIAGKAAQTALDAAIADIAKNTSAIDTLNNTTIPGINSEIAKKANSADVYTKDDIAAIVGTRAEGKTLVDMIVEAQVAATYDDTQVKADIKANTDAIAILNGNDQTVGSVDYKVAQEVAKILNDNDSSDIDTLNEIAAWITSDTTGAAKMNADIVANTAAIEKLNGSADTEGSVLAMIMANAPKIATADVAGIVKATTAENGISVAEDGTMSVNSVNVNKLVQTAGETLILNGGTANA